jgi:hypothetical protein
MRGSRNLSNRCSILAILCILANEASPQTDEVYSISTSQGNGRRNGSGRAK